MYFLLSDAGLANDQHEEANVMQDLQVVMLACCGDSMSMSIKGLATEGRCTSRPSWQQRR
jgi:hypothetical protein